MMNILKRQSKVGQNMYSRLKKSNINFKKINYIDELSVGNIVLINNLIQRSNTCH